MNPVNLEEDAETSNQMMNCFSPLLEEPVQPLPSGFDTYYTTFMGKQAFDAMFEAFKPRMQPPAIPLAKGFKNPRGVSHEVNNLTISAQSRLMLGLEPLFQLNQAPRSESDSELIKLVAISMGQAIAQLSHLRRVLVLDETWGQGNTEKRHLVLKACYEKKLFKATDTELFNTEFEDVAKAFSTATPASPATRTPTFIPRATARASSNRNRYVFGTRQQQAPPGPVPPSHVTTTLVDTIKSPILNNDFVNLEGEVDNFAVPSRKRKRPMGAVSSGKHKALKRSDPMHVPTRAGGTPSEGGCPFAMVNPDNESIISLRGMCSTRDRDISTKECPQAPVSFPTTGCPVAGTGVQVKGLEQPFRKVARHGPESRAMAQADFEQSDSQMGLWNRPSVRKQPSISTSRGGVSQGSVPASSNRQHDPRAHSQGDSCRVFGTQMHIGLVFKTQTRGETQTDHRPISTESIPFEGSFQDGELARCAGYNGGGQLDVQGRSQERVLFSSHKEGTSALPSVHMAGEEVDVHEAMLWPLPCPKDLHEDLETSAQVAEDPRSQAGSLYRRFLGCTRLQEEVQGTDTQISAVFEQPGLHGKWREEHHGASTIFSFPGDGDLIPGDDSSSPRREEEEITIPPPSDAERKTSISPQHGQVDRILGGDKTSVQDVPPVLPHHTEVACEPPAKRSRQSVDSSVSTPRGTSHRAGVLGGINSETETSADNAVPGPGRPVTHGRIRCRLGSYTGQQCSPWQVELPRIQTPYQCEGVVGSPKRTYFLRKRSIKPIYCNRSRQHVLSSVHPQEGRSKECTNGQDIQRNLGVSTSQMHQPGHSLHTRSDEYQTGLLIQDRGRKQGVEVESKRVPNDSQKVGPVQERPVCKSQDSPAFPVHHMGRGTCDDECISLPVEERGLCVSPVCSDRKSAEEGENGQMQVGADCPEMGSTTVVHTATNNVSVSSHITEIPQQPVAGPSGKQPSTGKITAPDFLAHRREQLKEVPREVQDYILKNELKESTLSSYEAKWKLWVSYCGKNGMNPMEPDIPAIATYLHHRLHVQGVKFTTVENDAAAISKYLPLVEGYSVFNHPIIKRLRKASYHVAPPEPKYHDFWDAELVLKAWDTTNSDLSLLDLSRKAYTLIKLVSMGRDADVSNFQLPTRDPSSYNKDDTQFIVLKRGVLTKSQQKGAKGLVKIEAFKPDQANICPVRTLIDYLVRTQPLRHEVATEVFVTSVKPYKPIARATGGRWLIDSLNRAGIDTTKYKGHSCRGAAANSKRNAGASVEHILKEGMWKSEKVLRKYYLRDDHQLKSD